MTRNFGMKPRDELELGAKVFVVGVICGPLLIVFGIVFLYLAFVSPAIEQERSFPMGVSQK